jgi:hypothetical protein
MNSCEGKLMLKVSRRDNLDRYYLFKLFGFGLFLHYIHDDEDPWFFHNHPWNGISIIFGTYLEERHGKEPRLRTGFNFVRAERYHRVTLPFGPVWTLFFHWPRKNRWSVIDRNGRIVSLEPWRGIGGQTSYKSGGSIGNPDRW